jgi:hyperosmotically inducible periplasmic protein
MSRRGRFWVPVVLAVTAACATVDRAEDLRIESEVKARLVAETDANLTRLAVVSTNGVVYLNGTVASPDQRARAGLLAKSVRGVRRVVNTLDVTTPSR